jgi:hypothetical protein
MHFSVARTYIIAVWWLLGQSIIFTLCRKVSGRTLSPPPNYFVPLVNKSTGQPVVPLPDGFVVGSGPLGFELMWTSESTPIQMGGSRYEFRFAIGVLLGYPNEIDGKLHLAITEADQSILSNTGASLEVWSSSRRIDGVGKSLDKSAD